MCCSSLPPPPLYPSYDATRCAIDCKLLLDLTSLALPRYDTRTRRWTVASSSAAASSSSSVGRAAAVASREDGGGDGGGDDDDARATAAAATAAAAAVAATSIDDEHEDDLEEAAAAGGVDSALVAATLLLLRNLSLLRRNKGRMLAQVGSRERASERASTGPSLAVCRRSKLRIPLPFPCRHDRSSVSFAV